MNSSFQDGRLLQLSTPLATDTLLPITLSVREFISCHFLIDLEMVSDSLNIDPKSVLNKPFRIKLYIGDSQPPRYFHGLVNSFTSEDIENQIRSYRAQLLPWTCFLNYRSNCRIFQNKNVPDIVEQIFQEAGFRDYDFSGINRSQYSKRDYCLQYNETDYNFIQRLLEDEGIFYFFRHSDSKHTLILADQNNAFKLLSPSQVQFNAGSNKDYCITSWTQSNQVYTGKVTKQDYNYESSDNSLMAQQSSGAQLSTAQQYETYHYPGGHSNTGEGNNRAQKQFEAHEAAFNYYRGSSNYPQFTAGGQFSFSEPPSSADAGNYVLLGITHFAAEGSYLHGVSGSQSYRNSFICLPAKVTFRPQPIAKKPIIPSVQTAQVVGSEGQEIDTDQYGRVKVQFHWDRQGKKNQDSSCWIRVAQMWAGDQWGMHFMPRIGQEVVVQFINGDPDRPLIVGSVYNDNNKTPYALPSSQTQSGIRTRSTKGGSDDYNELRFEDKQGSEEVFIQAQKDFNQNVKNNLTKDIGNNFNNSVKNNANLTIGKDYNHSVGNTAKLNIGKDFTQMIGNNSTVNVGQSLTQTITKDAFFNVGNNYNQTSNNSVVSVSNNATQTVANNATHSIGNNLEQNIGGSSMVNIGSTGVLQAGESLTLRVGGSSVIINSQGVFINGMQVKVNGS